MRIKNRSFVLFLFVIIFSITACFLYHLNSRARRSPITFKIDPDRPIIALTFDDGPNTLYTPQVLDILYENNALATFFICGQSIPGNEHLLKETVQCGHELGNHTNTHPKLTQLTKNEIIQEVADTQEQVNKLIPKYELKYIRPPYGLYNKTVEDSLTRPMVLWDIDSHDWEKTTVQAIYDHVLNSVRTDSIVIFHDDNMTTVHALKKIIPELQKRGFQFVTLSQFYEYTKE